MKKTGDKLLAVVMALMLVVSTLPIGAFAEEHASELAVEEAAESTKPVEEKAQVEAQSAQVGQGTSLRGQSSEYTISTVVKDNIGGSVYVRGTSNPDPLTSAEENKSLVVIATPESGYTLTGLYLLQTGESAPAAPYSIQLSPVGSAYSFAMPSYDVTVYAVFEEAPAIPKYKKFTLYFNAGTNGTGAQRSVVLEETSLGDAIEYTLPDYSPWFTPNEGYDFTGWLYGDDNTLYQPGDKISVTSDKAVFGQCELPGSLTVRFRASNQETVDGRMDGDIQTAMPDVTVKEEQAGQGASYILPQPGFSFNKEGYTFLYYKYAGNKYLPGDTIIVDSDIVPVRAVYTDRTDIYQVTVTSSGGGTARSIPAKGRNNQDITLTATPDSGYRFKEWNVKSGDVNLTDRLSETTRFFINGANVEIEARFEEIVTYTVTPTADPTEGGTVSGGGQVTQGQSATVTATANECYNFDGWYEGTTKVSAEASYTFAPTGDVTLTAKFKHAHNLTEHPVVPATYLKPGTEAYWHCDKCGGMFSDAAGENKIDGPVAIPKLNMPAPVISPAGGLTKTYDKEAVTLSVENTSAYPDGMNPVYQWYKGDSAIANANGSTYTVKDVSDSGEYSVSVTVAQDGASATATSGKINVAIGAKAASALEVRFADPTAVFICNGEGHKPAIIVTDGEAIVPSSSYSVTYGNNVNVSTEGSPATATVEFRGNYTGERELTFEVRQLPSKLKVTTVGDVEVNKEFTIAATLTDEEGNPLAGRELYIFVNNRYLTGLPKTGADGKVTVDYTPSDNSPLTIKAEYPSLSNPTSDTYAASKDEITKEVALTPSTLTLTTDKDQYTVGEDVTISGKLEDRQGRIIADAAIALSVNGTPIEAEPPVKTDAKGEFTHTIKSDAAGKFAVKATFAGIAYAIQGSAAEASFEVSKIQTLLDVSARFSKSSLVVTVKRTAGATGGIRVFVDEKEYSVTDFTTEGDWDRFALTINDMTPGEYTVKAYYAGDEFHTETEYRLPPIVVPMYYTVRFDPNPPDGDTARGSMNDQDREYDDRRPLTKCAYTIEGQDAPTFTGWNTKADGSGDAFADEDTQNVTDENGAVVTLYAMWNNPQITTNRLPEGTAGRAYSAALNQVGLTGSRWAISDGELPEGLSLDAGTGIISGTPKRACTVSLRVEVSGTDLVGLTMSMAKDLTMSIVPRYSLRAQVSPAGGGTVTFKKDGVEVTRADEGDELTLHVTPGDGYVLDGLSNTPQVTTIPLDLGSPVSSWKFEMPASDLTVSARFKLVSRVVFAKDPAADTCDAGTAYDLHFTIDGAGIGTSDRRDKLSVTLDGEPVGGLAYDGDASNSYGLRLNPTPGSLSLGDHVVEVSFAGDEEFAPCSGTFALAITTRVTGITLSSDKAKKDYTKGDALDVTSLTLTASKSDGSTETIPVTANMVSGFDGSKTGKQTLTVTYEGFTDTYDVEVKAPKHTVTYEVQNGTWEDGTTASKTEEVEEGQSPAHVPTGMLPANGFEGGSWSPDPNGATITDVASFTYTFDAKQDPPAPASISYDSTKGDGGKWTKGSGETMVFTFKRSVDDEKTYDLFTGIEVDGKVVDEENYTATPGSVVVTLSPEYLETLAVGSHTITARFEDGSAAADFTVVGEERQSGGEDNDPVKKSSTTPTETRSTTPTKVNSASRSSGSNGGNTGSSNGGSSGSSASTGTGSSTSTSKRTVPSTRDASDPAIWLALMSAAAGLLLAGTSRRRMRGR